MTTLPAPITAAKVRPSIGLALGGGGVRGLAHVLVLEVLDEMGLRPSIIAGTSIGALIGAAYALGMPGFRIRAMVEETLASRLDIARLLFAARSAPVQKVLRLLPLRTSLLDPEALLNRIAPELIGRQFSEASIGLKVVATDLVTRRAVVFEDGPLSKAVAASIAIPLVFSPVSYDSRVLLDGGLVNPLPFDLLAGLTDVTIAVDVSGAAKEATFVNRPTAVEVLMQSLQIMEKSITHQKLKSMRPDIYIDVDLDKFGALEFWRAQEVLAIAAPLKDTLRRQLRRVLGSRTAETLDANTDDELPPPTSQQGRLWRFRRRIRQT